MRTLPLVVAAVMLGVITTDTVAMPPHWHKPCVRAWQQYKSKPNHKAFAMSPVRTAMKVWCAMTWSAGSKAQAEAEALKLCASESKKSTICYILTSE